MEEPAAEPRPKFFNDRISKAKLLESAKKVRVAMDERKRKKAAKKKQKQESLLDDLEEEFEQPELRITVMLFVGLVVLVSALLTYHAYDIYNDGDGLVFFNDLANMIDEFSA